MHSVGIVGGSGYTGGEMLRLVMQHPELTLGCITSRQDAGEPVTSQWPQLAAARKIRFVAPEPDVLAECDLVFFATPHTTAMSMAAPLLDRGVRVVDLSADFRLKSVEQWEHWYGVRHETPELIPRAVYGLPEIAREAIRGADLVACPGCYPTAVLLGLVPLVEAGLVELDSLIADAKSGVSGAGRKATLGTLFGEVDENFRAYGIDGHRHLPEIRQVLGELAGMPVPLTFVPHLLPMFRGLQATLYATLKPNAENIAERFVERYADHPFVTVHEAGSIPETRAARGTNMCHIGVTVYPEEQRVMVISLLDNLVKGAAGQAMQNANLMLGLPETLGLEAPPFFP